MLADELSRGDEGHMEDLRNFLWAILFWMRLLSSGSATSAQSASLLADLDFFGVASGLLAFELIELCLVLRGDIVAVIWILLKLLLALR
jgi:hypothetical protein